MLTNKQPVMTIFYESNKMLSLNHQPFSQCELINTLQDLIFA